MDVIVTDVASGWWIVAGVALINMTNQSILSVYGLLFGTQLQKLNRETFSVALINNLNVMTQNFSGLFIAPIIENFKPKNVAVTGCLLVSCGLAISAFANQNWQFILGYSFFVGIGLGIITPSTFVVINSYFNEQRGRAVGVALAGAGLGQVLSPHIVRFLLDNYGFQTAVLTMAFISLTGIFGSILLKPLPPIIHAQRLFQSWDLDLLRDPIFLNIIIGLGLVYTTTINFTMIFPMFLQVTVGLSTNEIATCMSISAGADIACRLIIPYITDKMQVPYRMIFLFGAIGLLLSRSALVESTNLTSVIVMSAFSGMTKSATVINNNLTVSGHCRTDEIATGLGLNMISKGILVITLGQFLGWIRDYTMSYKLAVYAQNILLLMVVLAWTPEICYRIYQQNKRKKLALINSDQGLLTNG